MLPTSQGCIIDILKRPVVALVWLYQLPPLLGATAVQRGFGTDDNHVIQLLWNSFPYSLSRRRRRQPMTRPGNQVTLKTAVPEGPSTYASDVVTSAEQ